MNKNEKVTQVLDYLISIRHFAATISKVSKEELNNNDISCSESFYLALLSQEENGLTMTELSNLGKVDKSLTSRMVKNLINKAYIYKDTENLSTRNYKVKLTDKGKGRAELINNILVERYESFLGNFSSKELKVLNDGYIIIVNKFKNL